jgi:hypothetical protein
MVSKRTRYKIASIFLPSYWVRINRTDPDWDLELWELLENQPITFVGRYNALVGDKIVWIENHPYASGSLINQSTSFGEHCGRATSMLLNEKLKQGRIMSALIYPGETHINVNGMVIG